MPPVTNDFHPTMDQVSKIRREFDAAAAATNGWSSLPRAASPLPRSPKSSPQSPGAEFSRTGSKRTKVRPGNREILIVVMGAAGSGKSYFCRAAAPADGFALGGGPGLARHHLTLRTDDRESPVTLLDTSGFNGSSRHDAETPYGEAVALRGTYAQGRKFSGILYFHCLSDTPAERPTITDTQRRVFHELCGDDDSEMLKNVILVTNRWDLVGSEEGFKRQAELVCDPLYWKPMLQKGSQVVRFEGTTKSALELIQLLIHNTLQLKIQPETEGENKPLTETSAWRFVEAAIDDLRKGQKQTFAAMEEMQLALQNKCKEMQVLLEKESESSKKEIGELRRRQKMMKPDAKKEVAEEMEANAERILALLSEEREQWKEERERMGKEIAKLRANIEELEFERQRQRDEWDLKDAGYDTRLGQASTTNALSTAVQNRDPRIIRLLLAKDADPALCIAQPGGVDSSALHLAAEMGYGDAIDMFIESGVELDIVDSNGNTALIRSAGNGHKAVVDTLLGRGTKPDIKNKFGTTPLLEAARNGHEAVASLLLAKGAELDTVDNNGNTALIRAAETGHKAVVDTLLGKGAEPDIKNRFGTTPLLEAAKHGREVVASVLLAKGAVIDHAENGGNTPLIAAAAYGREALVRLLLEKRAKPDIVNNKGHSALTYAAWNGRQAIVDLLLKNDANLDITTTAGDTARTLATKGGHHSVVRLLDEYRSRLASALVRRA